MSSIRTMSVSVVEDLRAEEGLTLAPLSVSQYRELIQNGSLREGDSIELIEGVPLRKDRRDKTGSVMTHGPRHLRVLKRLTALLMARVDGSRCHVQVQGPIGLTDNSEPEPDCSLIRGTPDDYQECVPQASDALAVFEVADSSLRTDQLTKLRLYAAAQIAPYVIVNLKDNLVEVYQGPIPQEQRFASRQEYRRGEQVTLVIPGIGPLTLQVDELL